MSAGTTVFAVACPGVSVAWTPGSIWDSYPYLQHAYRDVGWEPIGFDSANNRIRIRAEDCQHPVSGGNLERPCNPCRTVPYSNSYREFVDRSETAADHTPWDYLTAQQHKALLAKTRAELMKLRTQLHNAKRKNKILGQKLTDLQRIIMLLASNDVPGLRRILTGALRRGASPQAIYSLLERAIAGLFSPRGGFTERDLDVAFLVKSLGGPRLLYALQKSHGLASRSTVMRNGKIPHLISSIGVPTRKEIDSNIDALLDPAIHPPPEEKLLGHAVMFDGVALETKNAVLGLCREHSHRVNTQVTDLQTLFSADGDKKVCFGSDATVVAIAPYGLEDHYTPIPITEKGAELAEWMQTLLVAWRKHPQGEALHGPIWALASDGDAAYRLAKHILCMVKELDPQSELGKKLLKLDGLNLLTSTIGEIVGTGDPKHVWKRFGTLLRNPAGVMIFETHILPADIVTHLSELEEMSKEKASQLLDPADKQNVPKAVSLIQHLKNLQNLPIPRNPTLAHQRNTIVFFSEVLGYFVLPFISMNMDLSEQVRSLSTYAHLLAGLQTKHGAACFTGPLYADSQAVVKNIMFIIARMQLINPNLRFWIIHEGTDRLELVFSDCRTLDHARNFDIEQLASKLSLSALINAAFQRNPDMDRGHTRLSVDGSIGVDHVNPKSCTANVRVGDVDLPLEWAAGRDIANALFKKYFGASAQLDFVQIFSKPNHDLQRPLGTYVGVRETPDDHRSELDLSESSSSGPAEIPVQPSIQPTATNLASAPGTFQETDLSGVVPSTPEDDVLGMDLDDFIPDSPAGIVADDPPPAASKFIEVEGKRFLKSSAVASLSSNRTKKVTMRTLRAQGVALEDLQKRKSAELDLLDLSDDEVMKTGDVVATLFQSGDQICLAILLVKGFKVGKDKSIRMAAESKDLGDEAARIRVVAQVMEFINPGISDDPQNTAHNLWEWTSKFIMLDLNAPSTRLTQNQLILEVPSVVVHSLAPKVAARTTFGASLESALERPTWQIDSEQLELVMEALWQSLEPESSKILENIQLLPFISNPDALPYSNGLGLRSFVIRSPKLPGKSSIPCLICGKNLLLNKMREHVGIEPCGWCGLDGCVSQLAVSKEGKHSIKSSCIYHYEKMNYKSAQAASNRSPCTNVPLHCSLCKKSSTGISQTIWKYNASYHLAGEHSNNNETLPIIPRQMMIAIFIRKKEESQLGVTAKITEQYRREEMIPDSEAIDAMILEMVMVDACSLSSLRALRSATFVNSKAVFDCSSASRDSSNSSSTPRISALVLEHSGHGI
ncbi:hypothetical protein C8R46DRAFT_1163839 [Mycena filopes]|nr:hypothetical protein C8R46DRAFT_1163839 [Mycena filopes]